MERKELRGNKASYQIQTRLGVGGFGQTWKATIISIEESDHWLVEPGPPQDSLVVVKWANLRPQYSADENRRFLQDVNSAINSELAALNLLGSLKCVARVYDYGHINLTLSDGSPQAAIFLVEEFLDGTRFDNHLMINFGFDLVDACTFTGIGDSDIFLWYAAMLSNAIRDIHHRGVIHGDIWPENIMVMGQDDLRFFDLGASAFRDTSFLRPQFLDKQRSDSYCAPERRLGERHGRRSDIYSLGGLFYYMATGKEPPAPIPDIDQLKNSVVSGIESANRQLFISNCGVADVIARCLRYNKDQRIRDADALLNELRLFSFPDSRGNAQDHTVQDCVNCLLRKDPSVDDLFSRMLMMDAAKLKSRADDMNRGILEVSGDHEDLVLGMSTYLSILDDGDTFLAKTTPKFWKTENMGINGRFLSMVKLVAQRGTTVKQLMLVSDSDRSDLENRRILEAHLVAIKQVRTVTKERLQFLCKVVSSDERQRVSRETRWECSYAISRVSVKVLQPIYDRNGILRTIRLVRQEQPTRTQILEDFEKELSKAIPLEDWLGKEVLANDT